MAHGLETRIDDAHGYRNAAGRSGKIIQPSKLCDCWQFVGARRCDAPATGYVDVGIGMRMVLIGQVLIVAVVFDVLYRRATGERMT